MSIPTKVSGCGGAVRVLWQGLASLLVALTVSAQDKPAGASPPENARLQSLSYFEEGNGSRAVATLAEAARENPKDRVIGASLYAAIRDHVWHMPQILPIPHKGPVRALALNANGTLLASGSDYGEVFVSPTEGAPEEQARARRKFYAEESDIVGLAFTQDSRRLGIVARGAGLSVRDLGSGAVVFTGARPEDGATAFAVGPNLIAVGARLGAVEAFDFARGKSVGRFQLPGGKIQALAFSRDGKKLAAGAGLNARVWNLGTGQPIGAAIAHASAILTVDFSYDGRQVVTAGEDGMAKMTDLETGRPAVPEMNCGFPVRKALVSPDGSQLATLLDDSSVALWDTLTGEKLAFDLREDLPLNDFVWTRSGLRTATVSEAGHATLWTMQNGTRRGELMAHGGPVLTAALSADSKLLATGCLDGLARVWRTDGGMPLPTVRAHTARARTAFYSRDGNHLITSSEDHTALHWISGEVRPFGPALKHRGKVTCAVFDQPAKRILSCDDTGVAQLWDAATGKADGAPFQHASPANWVDFHPNGQRLAVAAGAKVSIWDPANRGATVAEIHHPGNDRAEIKCARFSPDGKWLATASTDGFVRLWDGTTFQPAGPAIERGFPVLCVRFSPDSSRMVVAGEDAQAAVYDTTTWKIVGTPILAPGPVFSAAISADNQFVVIASLLLDAIQIFEISSGQPLGQGVPLPAQATCVDLHLPPDRVLLVACDDGTVRAVDSPFVTQDVPAWACQFGEEMVQLKKTGPNEFTPVPIYFDQLRAFAAQNAPDDNTDFSRLVRWKLEAGNQRHGMPRFISTLAANIESRVEERSVDALFECYEAVSGDALIFGALSLYLPNRRQGEFIADLTLQMEGAEPLARCYAAGTLIAAGRNGEAETVLAKALADAPEDARVVRRAAKLTARLARAAAATTLFEKALRLEPSNAETHRSFGWALYQFRRPAEAAAQFRLAQEIGGEMNDDLLAGLCLCSAAEKNDAGAREFYQRLVKLDPAWQKAAHLTELKGWNEPEIAELERVRGALFPEK